jgi:hypothetical protein
MMRMLLQHLAIRMLNHPQAALPALPANRSDHRSTAIVIGTVTPLLIRLSPERQHTAGM